MRRVLFIVLAAIIAAEFAACFFDGNHSDPAGKTEESVTATSAAESYAHTDSAPILTTVSEVRIETSQTETESDPQTDDVGTESVLQTQTTQALTESSSQTSATQAGTTDAALSKPEYLRNFKVGSDYFIGYDKTNDVILFEKNADERCYPASVTKIVTAIVAIENVSLDTKMKVGGELGYVAKYSSVAGLKSGQVLTLEDLLYGMILPSGNDAACTIAVNTARCLYGGELGVSEAKKLFMELCNEKLKAIGADSTHFSCPYGSYHSDHYTTVRDMLKISLYVMENPVFSKIAATKSWKATAENGEKFVWSNTNYLIAGSRTYHYEYATGIKNGYSQNAEYCLAASALKDGRELYAVTFHAPTLDKRYSDVKRFFETAYSAFG